MSNQTAALLMAIDANKATLDAARPLPTHTVASLREKRILEWTYHSNAIEGNTLTLRETKVVLEGITVGGKSLREHFEATNHRDAILYVEEIVAKREALTEWRIRNLHALVLKSIDAEQAGRYRQENVVMAGASATAPDFMHLATEMAELIEWHGHSGDLHPVDAGGRVAHPVREDSPVYRWQRTNGTVAAELRIDEGWLPARDHPEGRSARVLRRAGRRVCWRRLRRDHGAGR